jgi:hypothetical protein
VISGLRTPSAGEAALVGALHLRKIGGAHAIGVNTIYVPGQEERLLQIANRVLASDADQWYIASKLEIAGGEIQSIATSEQMEELAHILDSSLPSSRTRVMVDVGVDRVVGRIDPKEFRQAALERRWRLEAPLSYGRVHIVGIPDWIAFARLRWDGGIVDYEQKYARFVPPDKTRYGCYRPGRMTEVIRGIGEATQGREGRSEEIA